MARNSDGLRRYQQAMRDAKVEGRAYRDYVKQYYTVSKNLRKHGVNIGKTKSQVLTPQQFRDNVALGYKDPGKLVAEQFGLLSGNRARKLQSELKGAGKRISLQRVSVRQFGKRDWDIIDKKYNELLHNGLTSKAASTEISQLFFGSD